MSTTRNAGAETVPPRADWPQLPPQAPAGELLTEVILTVFRLNGRLMETATAASCASRFTAEMT